MRVLLIEDDRYLSRAIWEILRKENMTVDRVFDGEEGLDYALSDVYDVIILDLMLPNIDGMKILKTLRKERKNVPILILSAKSALEDKLEGLDEGADDYLTKPFEGKELIARIRALSRRKTDIFFDDKIEVKGLILSLPTLELSYKDKSFTLTLKESQILEILMKNPDQIISKDRIIEKVWGFESDAGDNNVETYISFLRRKLKALEAPVEIKTLRNQGYLLRKKDV